MTIKYSYCPSLHAVLSVNTHWKPFLGIPSYLKMTLEYGYENSAPALSGPSNLSPVTHAAKQEADANYRELCEFNS